MSKHSRWQPPHVDPAKVRTARPPIEPARRKLEESGQRPCSWERCPKPVDKRLNVALCMAHANVAFEAMNEYHTEQFGTWQSEQAERDAIRAESARKIEAGERLNAGDIIPGWVYYIQVDDTIKIGYAKSVANRMRAYPPSARLLAAEPGTKKLERERHHHFNAYLAHGREWFRDVQEIRDWIDALVTEYGKPDHMAYTYTTPQSGKQVTAPRGWSGRKRTAA